MTAPDLSTDDDDGHDKLRLLRRHIEAIGGVEAEVSRLHAIDGLDFSHIAARQGIPLPTVRTRFYRAMNKLRLRLAPP